MTHLDLLDKNYIYNILKNIDSSDIYPIECSYERTPQNLTSINKNIYSFFSLHYITEGEGYYKNDNQVYHLQKGDMFTIFPNKFISYGPNINNPWSYCWLNFSGLKAKAFLDRANITIDSPIIKNAGEEILQEYLNTFDILSLKKTANDIYCQSQLYKILAMLVEINNTEKETNNIEKGIHISKAISYINTNFSNPELSAKSVSLMLSLNENYFSRLFKEVMGIPFSKHIIMLRIQHACALMEQGVYSIKTIALMCGYNDALYFSKEFKKHINSTPSEYISKQKEKLNQI